MRFCRLSATLLWCFPEKGTDWYSVHYSYIKAFSCASPEYSWHAWARLGAWGMDAWTRVARETVDSSEKLEISL